MSSTQEMNQPGDAQGAAIHYKQWYEMDPVRKELEDRAFQDRGFESNILPDGRVVYLQEVPREDSVEIMVILDWLFPLKPPSVFAENLPEYLALPFEADGSVQVFNLNRPWSPEFTASISVDYFEEDLQAALESE